MVSLYSLPVYFAEVCFAEIRVGVFALTFRSPFDKTVRYTVISWFVV